jgi:hypothetical protein
MYKQTRYFVVFSVAFISGFNISFGNYKMGVCKTGFVDTTPCSIRANISVMPVSCYDKSNGRITLVLSGAAGLISYTLNNGFSDTGTAVKTFTNLDAGSYTIGFTDSTGCHSSISAVVTQPTRLTYTYLALDSAQKCNVGQSTKSSILIMPRGGRPPYAFSLDNINFTDTGYLFNIATGSYKIYVRDATGCKTNKPLLRKIFVEGDSQTVGVGLDSLFNRWSARLAQHLGANEEDQAVGAQSLAHVPSSNSLFDKISRLSYFIDTVNTPGYFIFLGTTDANNLSIDTATFRLAYSAIVDTLTMRRGWPSNRIWLISNPWNDKKDATFQAREPYFKNVIQDVAIVKKTYFVDLYTPLYKRQDLLQLDSIHLSEYGGHPLLDSLIETQLQPYFYLTDSETNTLPDEEKSFDFILPDRKLSTVVTDPIVCYGSTSVLTLNIVAPAPIKSYYLNSVLTRPFSKSSVNNDEGEFDITAQFKVRAGSYDVRVVDNNGCKINNSSFVPGPTARLAVTATLTGLKCFGDTGTVNLFASGGIAPYQYSVDSSALIGDSVFKVEAGKHQYFVKDSAGCSTPASFITISQPAKLKETVVATKPKCFSDTSVIKILPAGGISPYYYACNNDTFQANAQFNLQGGLYTLHEKDSQGCIVDTTITILPLLPLAATIRADSIICHGDSSNIQVLASGGSMPYSYSYNLSPYTTANTYAARAGSYKIQIKDALDCIVYDLIVLSQPANIKETVTATALNCFADSSTVNITASGGKQPYTYSYNNINYQASPQFKLPGGTYIFYQQDAQGCMVDTTITIAKPALLTVAINAGSILCNGNLTTVQLSASGGSGAYSYSFNLSAYTRQTMYSAKANTYQYSVKDSAGCMAFNSVIITQPGALISNHTITPLICATSNDGVISVQASGGTGPYLYELNTGTFKSVDTFSSLVPGNYAVVIKDSNSCFDTINNIVLQKPANACVTPSSDLIVKVYPNPTVSTFKIVLQNADASLPVEIRVMDINGRVVCKEPGNQTQMFILGAEFASGIYIAEIINGTQIQRFKLVKSR